MTITVELGPETEARLAAEASARGVAPEEYAGKLLREVLAPCATGSGVLTPEDVEDMLKALTEGSERLPVLPPEVNERASFYEDRL